MTRKFKSSTADLIKKINESINLKTSHLKLSIQSKKKSRVKNCGKKYCSTYGTSLKNTVWTLWESQKKKRSLFKERITVDSQLGVKYGHQLAQRSPKTSNPKKTSLRHNTIKVWNDKKIKLCKTTREKSDVRSMATWWVPLISPLKITTN